jgi:hypothetical protein
MSIVVRSIGRTVGHTHSKERHEGSDEVQTRMGGLSKNAEATGKQSDNDF